jgi:hypothetical protein
MACGRIRLGIVWFIGPGCCCEPHKRLRYRRPALPRMEPLPPA